MNKPNRPRGFEDRLLSELKTYVSERTNMNTTEESAEKTPRFRRVHKFSLAGAVGAIALGIGAVVALPALTASTAYAVEPKDDGKVHVEVRNPEDAAGLEDALADYDIKSKVDFPPKGKMCNPDRFTPVDPKPDENGEIESMSIESDDSGNDLVGFDVDPDDYKQGGDLTLVIEISESVFSKKEAALSVGAGLTGGKGKIGECDPIPNKRSSEEENAHEGEGETHKGWDDDGSTGTDDGSTGKGDDGSKSKDKD